MDYEEIHRINRFILSCLGQWPYQNMFKRKIYTIFIVLIIASIWPAKFAKLYYSLDNYDLAVECITPLGVHAICLFKLYNCMLSAKKIRRLTDEMIRDTDDREILLKYAEKGKWATEAYTMYIYGFASIYCIIPLWPQIMDRLKPLNESRPLKYLFPVEYFVDHEKYYYWILLHGIVITVVAISLLIAIDTQYMVLAMHACGRFAVAGKHLRHITELAENMKEDSTVMNKNKYICAVSKCIELHNKAIKYAILLESSYTFTTFFVLGLCLFLMSVTGVQVVNNLAEPEMVIRYSSFTFGQIMHLFCISMPGQKLSDHSIDIRYSINQCNWYDIPCKAQRMLMMILVRSSKSSNITAGKFYVMNMANFGTVMQTSMTYFTVLSSMR